MNVIYDTMTINIIVGVISIAICLLGAVYVMIGASVDKELDRIYLKVTGLLILFGIFSMLRQTFNGNTEGYAYYVMHISCFMEFFLSCALIYEASCYLYSFFATIYKPLKKTADILLFLHAAVLMISVFTGFYYTIDAGNVYRRASGYPLCYGSTMIMLIIDFYLLIFRGKCLRKVERAAFIIYLIMPLASVFLQMIFPGISYGVPAGALSLAYLYFYILSDRTRQYNLNIQENARMKIDILMAQIQPHFLYNSLSVIKSICRDNPVVAEQAIGEFADYLRYNMDSLTIDRPVSFSEELKHVKEYLMLQKLRFGDDLTIKYELECMDFSLPILTVQPIVENAVTYGIRKNESGQGTVIIKTKEYNDHFRITVTDDGPGFDESIITDYSSHDSVAENGSQGYGLESIKRSHIGVNNVKTRLKVISDGELEINSVVGKGTIVSIILPKGRAQ